MLPDGKNYDVKYRRDYFDRWMHDGISTIYKADFVLTSEVDMTEARRCLQIFKQRGVRVTYIHVLVRVLSELLNNNHDLHFLIDGKTIVFPKDIDIGVTINSPRIVVPVAKITSANKKGLLEIASEFPDIASRAENLQQNQILQLNRWGWFVPFGFLRRLILNVIMNHISWRRKECGSIMITCVPAVDQVYAFTLNTPLLLAMGTIKDRVIAHNEMPAVRPTAYLSLSVDHRAYNGGQAAKILNGVKDILTSGNLMEILERAPNPHKEPIG